MTRARHLLLAASLLGGLVMTAPASALPAGPAGLQAASPIAQVQMMRGERRMMRHRMMRRKMMKRRMMMRRM